MMPGIVDQPIANSLGTTPGSLASLPPGRPMRRHLACAQAWIAAEAGLRRWRDSLHHVRDCHGPDPFLSRAVLLGGASYRTLVDLPAVAENLVALDGCCAPITFGTSSSGAPPKPISLPLARGRSPCARRTRTSPLVRRALPQHHSVMPRGCVSFTAIGNCRSVSAC
jgi:hypothetical protein